MIRTHAMRFNSEMKLCLNNLRVVCLKKVEHSLVKKNYCTLMVFGLPAQAYHSSTYANTNGATIVASLSIINFGVSMLSLPQVIFSLGTAPE